MMDTETDYYKILQISQNATLKEAKQAYHALSRKWHPDKNLDNLFETGEKMKKINQAYQVLSDSEKRKLYDHNLNGIKNNSFNSSSCGSDSWTTFSNGARKEEWYIWIELLGTRRRM